MIENVSTQLTVFHCFAHCLLPGRAFASLYALLFLEKEAEIGGRVHACYQSASSRVTETKFLTQKCFSVESLIIVLLNTVILIIVIV